MSEQSQRSGPPGGVRFGLALSSASTAYPDAHSLTTELKEAEELGFRDVIVTDRPTRQGASPDPLALIAAAASVTHEVGLLGVCITPYRHPVQLARSLATLSDLAPGRVTLVAALGGDYERELHNFQVSRRELPERLEEGIRICRQLWTGRPLSLHGHHYILDEVQLPPPDQPPPVWLAHRARSSASIDRTARIADGWLASWVSPHRLRTTVEEISNRAEQHGRDPAQIAVACLLRIRLASTVDEAVASMAMTRSLRYGHPYQPDLVRHLQIGGPPDHCVERLFEFVHAGAQHVIIQLECTNDERADQLAWLVEDVLATGNGEAGLHLR